jgi:hypothetical protein
MQGQNFPNAQNGGYARGGYQNFNRNFSSQNQRQMSRQIYCYGCGAPNVMRSNCANCNPQVQQANNNQGNGR